MAFSGVAQSQTKQQRTKKRFRGFGRDYVESFIVRSGVFWVSLLPWGCALFISRTLAYCFYWLVPRRRQIALDNLEIAYGAQKTRQEKNKLVITSFQNLILSVYELFTTEKIIPQAQNKFQLEGVEHLEKAFSKGKGIVFAISHLGAWEYLGFLPYLTQFPCSVISRAIRNPYLNAHVHRMRQATGLQNILKENSVRKILSELKQNHLVAILIDQWAGKDGLTSTFFGLETSTTSIPARLAHRTQAAIVPGYCLRLPGGNYKILIRPEVPVDKDPNDWECKTTEILNRYLESEILKYPEQWIWTHRRWKKIN